MQGGAGQWGMGRPSACPVSGKISCCRLLLPSSRTNRKAPALHPLSVCFQGKKFELPKFEGFKAPQIKLPEVKAPQVRSTQ